MAPPDTKQKLVYTALQLFAEKGYGSTSVADVRQAADIHSGSLYHFFPGKQDLLLAVLQAYRDGIGPMLLDPAWRGVKDPVEKIFALLARYRASLVQTECTYGCPIGSLALELHEPDPPVRELLAKNFDGWIAAIGQCLDEAGDRLPAEIDRRELAGFVLTTMEGAVMQARTYRDIARFDGSVRQLRRYFDSLLRAGPSRAKPRARKTRSKRK
ncbi:MAG TPA: TetR/AcrR family transcriptional regulator [Nevskiaceae bacterium]|nr:TetR/AcrR family transcriptional regulator [Nevskiaceae bacterium]